MGFFIFNIFLYITVIQNQYTMIIELLVYMGVFSLLFIFCEVIASKFPNTRFHKWWRKNVIAECQECD